MQKKRVFISFDYDHDDELKTLLVNQSRFSDSPFEIADWSVKERLPGDWKAKVRVKIRQVDMVAVICGVYTDAAHGVNEEVEIAKEEGKRYFLLRGRPNKNCTVPRAARFDTIHPWTWDSLKYLIGGGR